MFCSGSESSQVEHFRPKKHFPMHAMVWENFLWACSICNLNKGDRFPEDPGIIDPFVDDVWEFCFIDEYGNMAARWRSEINDIDTRGYRTIETLGLDRDALQLSRQSRLDDLKRQIADSLALLGNGNLTVEDLRARIDKWISQPFQPDVADYFLKGPGKTEPPFFNLFAATQG
jgi:hypothetical protein